LATKNGLRNDQYLSFATEALKWVRRQLKCHFRNANNEQSFQGKFRHSRHRGSQISRRRLVLFLWLRHFDLPETLCVHKIVLLDDAAPIE
jgi:hypothetical protein